jgi:hypothetical protein
LQEVASFPHSDKVAAASSRFGQKKTKERRSPERRLF